MATAVPPSLKVLIEETTGSTVSLAWEPSGAASILQVREFPKPWETAREISIPAGTREYTVVDLLPTSTFQFRLVNLGEDGSRSAPGPDVTADTAAASCLPKDDSKAKNKGKGQCSIQ
jgi:hypothetical protein